jgi:hypothetical protein
MTDEQLDDILVKHGADPDVRALVTLTRSLTRMNLNLRTRVENQERRLKKCAEIGRKPQQQVIESLERIDKTRADLLRARLDILRR